MEKSIHSKEYAHFLRVLRTAREHSRTTQEQLAARLNETQSFVSKCERGERRLDIIELRDWCNAIGITITEFVDRLENTGEI